MPALPSAPSQRQLSDLRMERLQIHRWSNGAGLGLGAEYSGSPLQKLRLPLRDLVDVNVELLRQFDQRLLALQGSQRNFRLERRAVVPAYSFRFVIVSPDPQPPWPLSRQDLVDVREDHLVQGQIGDGAAQPGILNPSSTRQTPGATGKT